MKYYVVLATENTFKADDKVVAPSKDAIVANLQKMVADNQKTFVAFSKIEDAQAYANRKDAQRSENAGFVVLEIEASGKGLKHASVEIESADEKVILKGKTVFLSKAEFVQAHLEHLDASLKDAVALNIKGREVLAQQKEASVASDEKKDSDKKLGNLVRGLLLTGAFVGAAVAANVSGLTAAVLAYAGLNAGVAATFAASAALVTAASVVTYAAVSAV